MSVNEKIQAIRDQLEAIDNEIKSMDEKINSMEVEKKVKQSKKEMLLTTTQLVDDIVNDYETKIREKDVEIDALLSETKENESEFKKLAINFRNETLPGDLCDEFNALLQCMNIDIIDDPPKNVEKIANSY